MKDCRSKKATNCLQEQAVDEAEPERESASLAFDSLKMWIASPDASTAESVPAIASAEKLRMRVDSVSAVEIVPENVWLDCPVEETVEPKAGRVYTAANWGLIP